MNKYFCTFFIRELSDEALSWLCDAADRDEAESLFWEFVSSSFQEYTTELVSIESLQDISKGKL